MVQAKNYCVNWSLRSLPRGYTNDLLGRRTSKNAEQYGYNVRDELISADEISYAYDDIGNRTTAEGKSYTANNLNQYTAIDDFTPTYDLDGNQTTVKTATGIWQVEYNAENRPVRWTQGTKVITMAFDRLGRRVSYREMNGATQIAHTVFLYNGYLCIQQLFSNEPWNVYKEFIWDPTEPVATRPLAFRQYGKTATFLMHDGNKNVTDVVTVGPANTPVAHVDYAPFGAATLSGTRATDNPFRFSSEFHDDTLALVYYNYRHYNPTDGRWNGRDLIEIPNLYLFNPSRFDFVELIAREDLQWLLNFFLECSTSTDIKEDLRKAYSEAFKLLADKIENLDDKEKRAGLLDRVEKILNESLDAIDALEARLATERDADKKSRIKEALEIANNTVNVLSVVNATSGEITPKDVSRVLTYFLDMTSKSLRLV